MPKRFFETLKLERFRMGSECEIVRVVERVYLTLGRDEP